jgi:hypothetical protein
MSATDFGDPDQIIHIPARDLTGTLWQVYGTYVLPVGPDGLQIDAGKYASMRLGSTDLRQAQNTALLGGVW